MAKDKAFEQQYKEIGLRRTALRKQKRTDRRMIGLWNYGRKSDSKCPNCDGTMNWCSCCQVWSRSCCVEYGTCQCS